MLKPDVGDLNPPDRILMGPGPSDVHPRVLRAMSTPLVGHLDPAFIEIMQEVQALLRYTFRTDNRWTIPVSGTGSAAMEAAFANMVEPGDVVLVPTNGYFGARMDSMARRAGGQVVHVNAPWGEPLDPADVRSAFEEHRPKVFGFVHAETSTGALQPNVPDLTAIAHEHDAFVIADTVTSLGGVELRVDDWNIDVAYSGGQKCLSCPPGASPLTLNDRAFDKVRNRGELVRSWYLDVGLLESYWGDDRSYHHTAPITAIYGLREALRLVCRGGNRGALGAPSPYRWSPQGGGRSDGSPHEPERRVLASQPERGSDSRGRGREGPVPTHPRHPRDRDRRRTRRPGRQDHPHRLHGTLGAAPQRAESACPPWRTGSPGRASSWTPRRDSRRQPDALEAV